MLCQIRRCSYNLVALLALSLLVAGGCRSTSPGCADGSCSSSAGHCSGGSCGPSAPAGGSTHSYLPSTSDPGPMFYEGSGTR